MGMVTEQKFLVTATGLFAVLVDPDTYPRWLVGTKEIRIVSSDWPTPGSSFKHRVGFGPISISDRTTVRDIESPNRLTLFVRARPVLEAVVQFDVTNIGRSCLLTMTETPVGLYKIMAPLAGPLIRARNERSLRRLKDLVEARSVKTATGDIR